MVRAVRGGRSLRQVARRFRVGLATVHRWVRRAGRGRLDRVEWTNRPPLAHSTRRTPRTLEERVLSLRQQLKTSDLGQFGAVAIHRALQQEGLDPSPACGPWGGSWNGVGCWMAVTGCADRPRPEVGICPK